ncbi:unnamed protein product [Trichobilharzia regenti]|nr:unnamed protein product [Trichobilharzia regenti]
MKGSFSDESGKRRRSSYFISPKYHLGSVKSSNSSEKELERSGVNVKASLRRRRSRGNLATTSLLRGSANNYTSHPTVVR